MRRLTIICLSAALLAIGLLSVVENHERPNRGGQPALGASCPQPEGMFCRTGI